MKKTIIVAAIFSISLISCNQTKQKDHEHETVENVQTEEHSEYTEMTHKEPTLNNDWVNEISLNDGAKWDANIETTQGVNNMLSIIKDSNLETEKDYQALGKKLNEEKNILVKKCTMKGPSHDNLHVFLHPLIEKIDQLMEVSSTEQGTQITKSIHVNLKSYSLYFQ